MHHKKKPTVIGELIFHFVRNLFANHRFTTGTKFKDSSQLYLNIKTKNTYIKNKGFLWGFSFWQYKGTMIFLILFF